MPKIQIRPAIEGDILKLMALEHDYTSEYVWQMDTQQEEDSELLVQFRTVRLPRSVKVDYPRSRNTLPDDWTHRSGLLVAELSAGEVIGYTSLSLDIAPVTTWATDLVVARRMRRQGIGSALVLAAREWARQHGSNRLILEMQPKNQPAIALARKLGFYFCGYNDRYYINHDIALFFSKSVR